MGRRMESLNLIELAYIFFARARARIYRSAIVGMFAFLPVFAATPHKNFTDLISSIQDPKLSICLPAIEDLARTKNPDAVNPLANALAIEKRPLVRRYLVDALGELGSANARPFLMASLKDPDS